MIRINEGYLSLTPAFFFTKIGEEIAAFEKRHPGKRLLHLGVGDVTKPLAPVVIEAMHRAVSEQGDAASFHGYLPETGTDFLKEAIVAYYARRNVTLSMDEVFISSGAADDLGAILHLFSPENRVLLIEPAYPAYADANQMDGRKLIRLPGTPENGFLPLPSPDLQTELVYLCSPNNPTGAAYTRGQLQQWVDWAKARQALILFDAAYEAFIADADVPHSILELPGAETCAIEISSLSKTAGFTGMRLGYTVVPKDLRVNGVSLNDLWRRDRCTRTNGVSYIMQRAGEAALSEEGQRQNRVNIDCYRENGRILSDALRSEGLWFTGGRNAPYLWLMCPDGMSGWAFFSRLLEQAQIVGTPGEGFGPSGAGYLRLSCFASRGDTEEGARRLMKAL
ncbi:MAG: LL-diaminopimelate aminotransferase [Clostridia bacterium]|nr:LL-diaminopimelate aminotransferase [Clostridia bacterium]